MDLEMVLDMSGTVLIGVCTAVQEEQAEYWASRDYSFVVREVLRGSAQPGTEIECLYVQDYPQPYTDADGSEVWEWPYVSGSGMELLVSAGDTLILLLNSDEITSGRIHSLARIEPLEMREEIERLIAPREAGVTGEQFDPESVEIEAGNMYELRFYWMAGKWWPYSSIALPTAASLRWDWTNSDEWEEFLSDTFGTLVIGFEVTEVHEIEYRPVLDDMPERLVTRIVCRILNITRWEDPPPLSD
jgi:hypothetical protein